MDIIFLILFNFCFQAHIKPPEPVLSTNPEDYELPPIELPPFWKSAISTKGKIYYYHTKIRIPQWEPPIFLEPLAITEDEKIDNELQEGSSKSKPKSKPGVFAFSVLLF